MLRRLAVVMAGLASGIAAAVIALPIAVMLAGAWLPDQGAGVTVRLFNGFMALLFGDDPGTFVSATIWAVWATLLCICCAPLPIVALIGEVAGARGAVWLIGGSAIATAIVPRLPALLDGRIIGGDLALDRLTTVVLLFTGTSAGVVYWLIAGRFDQSDPKEPVFQHRN